MAYFNGNGDFHSPSCIPEELDSHPFLQCYTLTTTDEVYQQVTPTSAGGWTTIDQPRSTALPSTSLLATTDYSEYRSGFFIDLFLMRKSLESVSPTFCSYPALSCGSNWSTINRSTQPDHSDTLSQDNLFAKEQLWDTTVSSLTPNPSEYRLRP